MVFFYLVTTGWIFEISFCEISINQSKVSVLIYGARCVDSHRKFVEQTCMPVDSSKDDLNLRAFETMALERPCLRSDQP